MTLSSHCWYCRFAFAYCEDNGWKGVSEVVVSEAFIIFVRMGCQEAYNAKGGDGDVDVGVECAWNAQPPHLACHAFCASV